MASKNKSKKKKATNSSKDKDIALPNTKKKKKASNKKTKKTKKSKQAKNISKEVDLELKKRIEAEFSKEALLEDENNIVDKDKSKETKDQSLQGSSSDFDVKRSQVTKADESLDSTKKDNAPHSMSSLFYQLKDKKKGLNPQSKGTKKEDHTIHSSSAQDNQKKSSIFSRLASFFKLTQSNISDELIKSSSSFTDSKKDQDIGLDKMNQDLSNFKIPSIPNNPSKSDQVSSLNQKKKDLYSELENNPLNTPDSSSKTDNVTTISTSSDDTSYKEDQKDDSFTAKSTKKTKLSSTIDNPKAESDNSSTSSESEKESSSDTSIPADFAGFDVDNKDLSQKVAIKEDVKVDDDKKDLSLDKSTSEAVSNDLYDTDPLEGLFKDEDLSEIESDYGFITDDDSSSSVEEESFNLNGAQSDDDNPFLADDPKTQEVGFDITLTDTPSSESSKDQDQQQKKDQIPALKQDSSQGENEGSDSLNYPMVSDLFSERDFEYEVEDLDDLSHEFMEKLSKIDYELFEVEKKIESCKK